MNKEILECLTRAAQAVYDKKGFNILLLNVIDICSMTDYFLIAEGNVDRHVKALGQTIMDELAKDGLHPAHVEGLREGDWLVLDYVHFVIHLFTPELREKYTLERLWHKGIIVDIPLKIVDDKFRLQHFKSNEEV